MIDWQEVASSLAREGAPADVVAEKILESGASFIDAVKAIRTVYGLDLRSAKAVVRGTPPPLDPADEDSIEHAMVKYADIDAVEGDPATTLNQLLQSCEAASDRELGWLAILVLEPLLDCHAVEIVDLFAAALRRSPKVRITYGNSILHIPAHIERVYDEIVATNP